MELRITNIFNPLARAAGFFLSEMGVTPTRVALLSFGAALLSAALFISSYQIPLISAETAVKTAVALIFVNAFLDDVERSIEKRSRKKSIFGGPLGVFLGQLSDLFILLGALLFLALKDTYYNFGRLWVINLSYVEPGLAGHLGTGTIAAIGILLLRYRAAEEKEKGAGLWTRSERMYLFGAFATVGVFSGLFSGTLFLGVIVLTVLVYLSLLRRAVKIKGPSVKPGRASYRIRRAITRGFRSTGNLLWAALRTALRAVGVILLGIYLVLEKIYLQLGRAATGLKRIQLSKHRAEARPVAEASAPAGEEAETFTIPEQTSEEEPALEAQPPSAELDIEMPPPEKDLSYMGEADMAESMLVEYEPSAKKETVMADVMNFMLEEGKDIVLVSTQPATAHYRERFSGVQGVRIINLPDQAAMPSKDEIPMTNLEYFSEVFETLTKDHVFIFEPLSNLILNIGVGQAYRFISQTLNRLSTMGVTFIVFMNREGHDKKDISNFENLFMNIAEIDGERLKKVR